MCCAGQKGEEEEGGTFVPVEVWLGEYCSARGANWGLVLACSGFSPGVGLRYRAKVHALEGKGGFHHSDLHLHSSHHCTLGQRTGITPVKRETFEYPLYKKCPKPHTPKDYLIIFPSLPPSLPLLPSSHTRVRTLTPQSQKHIHPF